MEQVGEAIDLERTEAFLGKMLGDFAGMMASLLCSFGDRLGLFKDLAANGPATSEEMAARTGLNARYLREWLDGMACAGYLEYDPATARFTLPPEHTPALADEGGPFFMGGWFQQLAAIDGALLDRIAEAFRAGGGVGYDAYRPEFWQGMERATAAWFEHQMVQEWVPAASDVRAKLERGALVADVGCGRGRALLKLAQAFPRSRYVGYDVFQPNVESAAAAAAAAGVADRVRFAQRDVAEGLPELYDVITTFDVIHDLADPRAALRAIRQALRPDGTHLWLEIRCSDKLEENLGPLGTVMYGSSLVYCMTTSLATGGEGLGTLGLPEPKVRALAAEAGFGSVRRISEDPFNVLYELKP